MPTHTSLKGVNSVYESLLSDQLEANLLGFFQWGFLGVGGFFDVTISQSGSYGGDESRLRLVNDPNYNEGQVWEGFRKDWVWETGVEYVQQPIHVSGVYVNNTFYPVSGDGAYAHNIDYPNGRVIFDSPISTSSTVKCEYSYRLFQICTADIEWWKKLQPNSFRVDDTHFLQIDSGVWDSLAQNRMQLPAVVIDAVPNVQSRTGFQIGSQVQTVLQDVIFHIFSEDKFYYKWLHDAITNQNQKRLIGFNKNEVINSEAFPIDIEGFLSPSGQQYPDLVKNFSWKQIRFEDVRSQEQPMVNNIFYCVVRIKIGVDVP